MARILFALALLLLPLKLSAQGYNNYKTIKHNFYSASLDDSVLVDIQYPLSFDFGKQEMTFPLIILFDSQHDTDCTYKIRQLLTICLFLKVLLTLSNLIKRNYFVVSLTSSKPLILSGG